MFVQFTVDNFADKCTNLARNLNTFINIIQQEDISLLDNYDCMREVGFIFNFSFLSNYSLYCISGCSQEQSLLQTTSD